MELAQVPRIQITPRALPLHVFRRFREAVELKIEAELDIKLGCLPHWSFSQGEDFSPVSGTWYKDTTSVVVSQLRVLNCCRLLKVFGICVQILIKATTFWIQRNLDKF